MIIMNLKVNLPRLLRFDTRAGCCKKQKKKFLTSYWFAEFGTSEGPE